MKQNFKILFLGDLNCHTESTARLNAFEALGWQSCALSSQKIPYFPGLGNAKGRIDKIIRRFLPMHDPNKINKQLLMMLKNKSLHTFDVLWSDKALNLKYKTLLEIKQNCPKLKLIFASGDNIAVPEFRNKALEDSLYLFDAVITAKSTTLAQLRSLGARKACYIPKAFDERWPERLTKPKKIWDISFIGSFEKERADSMLALAQSGQKINVWGNGWERFKNRHPNLIIHGYPVYFPKIVEIIEQTKINLCFLRKLAKDTSTNRTFEIPACGGFMLAEGTQEQKSFFEPDLSAAYFENDHELIEKCDFYLKNEKIRNEIAISGHERCLSSQFGYKDRCRQFEQEIWRHIKC